DHARTQPLAATANAVVTDLRFFVELPSDAVTYEVLYDAVTQALGELLNGGSDVPESGSWLDFLDPQFQAFAGRFCHPLGLFGWRAHVEGGGRIAVKAFVNVGDIYVDDVAFAQDLRVGDAMAHDLVYRGANTLGKAMVIERCRLSPFA